MHPVGPHELKPIDFIGSSYKDLKAMPASIRSEFGHALYMVQLGRTPANAKPLRGFGGGAGVVELIEDDDGDTYRATYTVRFPGVVYVLHVFKKKSKSGIATPPKDIALIKARLKAAEIAYKKRLEREEG